MSREPLGSSEDFAFEAGDRVRVRVREHGDTGNIKAKFEADVRGFHEFGPVGTDEVCLDPPWESASGVTLRPYDAEFEVLGGGDDGE